MTGMCRVSGTPEASPSSDAGLSLHCRVPGGPLDARMKAPDAPCDLNCVLMLAGGIHRSLPNGTRCF